MWSFSPPDDSIAESERSNSPMSLPDALMPEEQSDLGDRMSMDRDTLDAGISDNEMASLSHEG